MKTHYDVLGLDPATDADTIKKAFRREIARYHPDKVVHLGPEFQAIASTKATELTAAYTTLSDPQARAEYDRVLEGGRVPPPAPQPTPAARRATRAPESPREEAAPRSAAPEPGGRDDIMRRATIGRLRTVLKTVMNEPEFVPISGFDLGCLARGKSSLFRRSTPPSVLVRLASLVDRNLVSDACAQAVRARIEQKPLILLLVGDRLAPTGELGQAVEEHRRRNPALADTMFPVPVELRDWNAKIPANAPSAVRDLIHALKNYAG